MSKFDSAAVAAKDDAVWLVGKAWRWVRTKIASALSWLAAKVAPAE